MLVLSTVERLYSIHQSVSRVLYVSSLKETQSKGPIAVVVKAFRIILLQWPSTLLTGIGILDGSLGI